MLLDILVSDWTCASSAHVGDLSSTLQMLFRWAKFNRVIMLEAEMQK